MKILIIGCGRVGSGLAKTLGMRGHQVTVVDSDPRSFEKLGKNFKGKTFVGIGFDHDVLVQAGIKNADALAAVTESDEANVVAARMAKKVFKVPRVAARVYDPRKAEIYRRFGLQIISPVTLAVNRMAELMTFSQMASVSDIGTGEVECIEVEVPLTLVGRPVGSLEVSGEIHVITLTRNGKTFLPTEGSVMEESDLIHLAVLSASSERLKKMLE